MATDFFFPPELLQIRPQGAQAALRHAAPRHARKTAPVAGATTCGKSQVVRPSNLVLQTCYIII